MKYVAAYLLASLSGKEPSAEVIKAIFGSVGIDYDESLLSHVFSQLKGKAINDVIAEGSLRLASFSVGASSTGAEKAASSPASAEAAVEEKEEETKKSEDEFEGGLSLFGDDDDDLF